MATTRLSARSRDLGTRIRATVDGMDVYYWFTRLPAAPVPVYVDGRIRRHSSGGWTVRL